MPVAGAGDVTVIVPVTTAHVDEVDVAIGCVGTGGGALIITIRAGEVQP